MQAVSVYLNILSRVIALVSKAVTRGAVTGGDIRGLAGTVTVTSPSAVRHHKGAPSRGDSGAWAGDSHHLPSAPRGVTELAVPGTALRPPSQHSGARRAPGRDRAAPRCPRCSGQAVPAASRAGKGRHSFGLRSALASVSSLEFLPLFPGSTLRMDAGWAGLLLTLLLLLLSVLWLLGWSSDTKRSRLPPGPAPWPILGNLWQKDVLPLYRHHEKVRDKWPCWTHSQPPQDRQQESAKIKGESIPQVTLPTFLLPSPLPHLLPYQNCLNPFCWEQNQPCYQSLSRPMRDPCGDNAPQGLQHCPEKLPEMML